jgi:hypothetical protein
VLRVLCLPDAVESVASVSSPGAWWSLYTEQESVNVHDKQMCMHPHYAKNNTCTFVCVHLTDLTDALLPEAQTDPSPQVGLAGRALRPGPVVQANREVQVVPELS